MSPKFSIVVPTIGRLDMIRRALYTAFRQGDHYHNYEIVVLDNCSEDGTWQYLQGIRNTRLKIVRNSHRLPQAANWNKAVRQAEGEFIYMLADDNVLLPGMLATVYSYLEKYTNVDLVCFSDRYSLEDEHVQVAGGWQYDKEEFVPAPHGLMRFGMRWGTNASFMMFSKSTYLRHGEFYEDHDSPILSDLEYILRWMIHCNVLVIPHALTVHRIWSGAFLMSSQNTPEMLMMLGSTISRILSFASESGRLGPEEIRKLRQTLVQLLLIDFPNQPVKDMFSGKR